MSAWDKDCRTLGRSFGLRVEFFGLGLKECHYAI